MIGLSKFNNANFSRGSPKWKEALWWVARSLFLRWFGAKIGNHVVIRSRVNITFPWKLEIGDHVWIGDEVLILSLDKVRIGSNVCISQRAFLCTGSHDFRKETFDLVTEPITIGDGCWIAACAFMGPGAEVPAGTMVKAGQVWRNGAARL